MKLFNLLLTIAIIAVIFFNQETTTPPIPQPTPELPSDPPVLGTQDHQLNTYLVSKVIDGDTIDVLDNEQTVRIRLIGVNTPETSDPRRPIECYGQESKAFLTSLLASQTIQLESDSSQSQVDQYGRQLRYAFLNNQNINLQLIKQGYAYEYTYDNPYKYQSEFQQAQAYAQENTLGLWNPQTCNGSVNTNVPTATPQPIPDPNCTIKGNISQDRKIYHLPTCRDYARTVISTDKGEQWFCTETQALQAGWIKALNC